jgi:DNA/RNA endonuclease YhcR with UshA esterase domain
MNMEVVMKNFHTIYLVCLSLIILQLTVFGQISLSTTTPYTQNFDTIGTPAVATLPSGWRVDKVATVRALGSYLTGGTSTERQGGNGLTSTASNGIYNFGAGDPASAPDRAVGFLSSGGGTQSGNLYAHFKNTSGSSLKGVIISYEVEKYRRGTNSAGFRIQMYYSTDGTSWTDAGPLFLTSWGADASNDGYTPAPGDSQRVVSKGLAVTIPNDSSLYLAWNYSVSSGTTTSSAQALALDDFSIIGSTQVIDNPPQITGVGRSPKVPAEDQPTTVSASVTDDHLLSSVLLKYRINGGADVSIPMSLATGSTYSGVIPASAYGDGDRVEYWVSATDSAGQTSVSAVTRFWAGTTPIQVFHAVDGTGVTLYLNEYARVKGVATAPNNLYSTANLDVYIQDATGGINIFKSGAAAKTIVEGNYYTVVGAIAQFNGKLEIIPDDTSEIVDGGKGPVVVPRELSIAALLGNAEVYENSLVKIRNVSKSAGTWPTSATFVNLTVNDGGVDTLTLRVNTTTGGVTEPTYPVNIVGVIVQFDNTPPFTSGYQILPRSPGDIRSAVMAVASSTPADGASNVALQSPVSFTFTAPLDTFQRFGEARLPIGLIAKDPADSLRLDSLRLSSDLKTITFYLQHTPNTDFSFILTAARSIDGDNLATPYVLNYTTAASSGTRSVSGTVTRPVWAQGIRPVVGLLTRSVYAEEPTVVRAAVANLDGSYSITGVRDGVYWPTSAVDVNGDGDINSMGSVDLLGFYDPNNDGVPDSVVVSGGNLTGIDIVFSEIVPVTARGVLARANHAASRFAGDQQLKVVAAPLADSTGQSIAWFYIYYSPSLQKATFVVATTAFTFADTGGVFDNGGSAAVLMLKKIPERLMKRGPHSLVPSAHYAPALRTMQGSEFPLADMLTIPSNFIDSDSALAKAERGGGSTIRAQNPNSYIFVIGGNLKWVYPQDTSRIFWGVVYNILTPDSTLVESYMLVDMTTGDLFASGTTGSVPTASHLPLKYQLDQNYPNPFNPETVISFEVGQREFVSLKVYNVIGQEVASLVAEELPAGRYSVRWDGRDSRGRSVASGLYLYRITAGSFTQTRKMILLR